MVIIWISQKHRKLLDVKINVNPDPKTDRKDRVFLVKRSSILSVKYDKKSGQRYLQQHMNEYKS